MSHAPADPAGPAWPAFVCLILIDEAGRFVLEHRPSTAKAAPGKLTCFGGKREPGERPEAALDRELSEELGLSCAAAGADCSRVVLTLLREGDHPPVAWFYSGRLPKGVDPVCRVPGHAVVRVDAQSLAAADLAPWHRAALAAFTQGRPTATIPPPATP